VMHLVAQSGCSLSQIHYQGTERLPRLCARALAQKLGAPPVASTQHERESQIVSI
jgi:hypothetical protein